jgi:hypothetical protein
VVRLQAPETAAVTTAAEKKAPEVEADADADDDDEFADVKGESLIA